MDFIGSEHELIGPILASHECKWTLTAAEHQEAAEKAQARKKRELAKRINAPAEVLRKLTAVHDWEIAHHERQGRIHRRRAAIAASGYLLDSPDERQDARYQLEHADLIRMAKHTGRLCHTED
jgi:hypothetical protein